MLDHYTDRKDALEAITGYGGFWLPSKNAGHSLSCSTSYAGNDYGWFTRFNICPFI